MRSHDRLVLLALLLPFKPAVATASDVHLAMSNRIGLIAYCRAEGHLTQQAAETATARVATARDLLPAAARATAEASAAREESGRQGKWGTRGMPIADRAKMFGQTVAEFCAEQTE